MSEWESRDRGLGEGRGEPLAWVVAHLACVQAGGTVLDVACGRGRHLRAARARGLNVVGIDRDLGGVSDLAGATGVELVAADLEGGRPWPLPGRRFDAVIVTNYLHRPLFPALIEAVAEGGLLIYETFQVGNERYGRPLNAEFLLAEGELAEVVAGQLEVIRFEQALTGWPLRSLKQRIAARRPRSHH